MKDFYQAWSIGVGSARGKIMWKSSFMAVKFTLWKERNSRCFNRVSSSKEAIAFKVEFLVASWVSVLPIFRGYSIDDITICWKEVAFSCPFIP